MERNEHSKIIPENLLSSRRNFLLQQLKRKTTRKSPIGPSIFPLNIFTAEADLRQVGMKAFVFSLAFRA